ncbi:MAG: hypothetical protein ACW98X_21920 [Promethearchaeota archaeon]|jgi:hypothetical protein
MFHYEIKLDKFLIFLSKFTPLDKIGGLTYFPWIVYQGEMNETTRNHEKIHIAQQFEMIFLFFVAYCTYFFINFDELELFSFALTTFILVLLRNVPFLILYYGFYLLHFMRLRIWSYEAKEYNEEVFQGRARIDTRGKIAYLLIPFEYEAYTYHKVENYLRYRQPFAWTSFIFKRK